MAVESDTLNYYPPGDLKHRIVEYVTAAPWSLDVLEIVRALSLPDWAIGAGFVRSLVWDKLSNNQHRTPLPDIDILFHDPDDCSDIRERALETRLHHVRPDIPWSVKNQARMHLRNGDEPYSSTNDAIKFWLETVTCVAVRLENNNSITVLAPFGLTDLFNMTVQPTPSGWRKIDQYQSRMRKKSWPDHWPDVCVLGMT